jgi:hypothetical protein
VGQEAQKGLMMFFSVATHNEAKNAKGFIHYDDVEFSDIPKMVMSGYAYSAGKFKDNHRKNDNWEGCEDVLILDIDDGCTIKQAMEIFKKYRHFIITSRSHLKDKNGLVCERFRIFLQLENTINDIVTRDAFIKDVMNVYCFVDGSCKDRGRFFYASPDNAEVFYTEGKLFPVIVIETPQIMPKEQKAMIIPSNDIYRLCELKNVWIDKNGNELESGYSEDGVNYDAKLKGIKIFMDGNYYNGNKHHCLVSCIYMMRNDGFDDDYIVNWLFDECNSRIPVSIKDIVNIVKRLK